MRAVAMLLVLGIFGDALAQEVPVPPPLPPPAAAQPLRMPAPPPPPLRLTVPEPTVHDWHSARVMSGFGDAFGIIGTGLSLGALIYIAATNYPPNVGDFTSTPKLSDPVQVISLVGSTMSAVGFSLAAGSLSWRHHILDALDADTGHGLFVAGTIIGLGGLVGVGASYFFGFTDYLNPHNRTIAVIATSLGGAALCTIGTILYSRDAAKLNRAWERATTF